MCICYIYLSAANRCFPTFLTVFKWIVKNGMNLPMRLKRSHLYSVKYRHLLAVKAYSARADVRSFNQKMRSWRSEVKHVQRPIPAHSQLDNWMGGASLQSEACRQSAAES